MPAKLKTALVLLALFVLPYFLQIAYFSHFDNDVTYLRGGGPPWMLNPEDRPVVNGFPTDFPAYYETVFNLVSPPARGHLRLSATNAHVLTVNGTRLSSEAETVRRNWKTPLEYDIKPFLVPGENFISIYVHSPRSITALKAAGEVVSGDGSQVSLDSGYGWTVRSAKPFAPTGVTGAPHEVELLAHYGFLEKIKSGEYWNWSLLLFACAAVLMLSMGLLPGLPVLIDRAAYRLIPGALSGEGSKRAFYRASVALIFIVMAATLYHNFMVYPAARTGDIDSHTAYYNYFLRTFRPPLANEGGAMYNPPGLYFVSAALFRVLGPMGDLTSVIRYAQLVSSTAALLTVVVIFLALKLLVRNRAVVTLTLAVAAFLPMSLLKAPSISPESLSALMCALSLYFWLVYTERPSMGPLALAALSTGLAFLTRWTTLFAFMGIGTGFLCLILRGGKDRRMYLRDTAIYVGGIVVISGWYYIRNIVYLHTPFPSGLFFFRQVPGYRDWHFFTNVMGLFINNPLGKENVMESYLAGMYNTFWFDGQRFMVSTGDYVLVFALLALALLPTVLMVRGALLAAGSVLDGGNTGRAAFCVSILVTIALSLAAIMYFNIQGPLYSTVKAFYVLYLILPFMCLLGLGLKAWTARRGYLLTAAWFFALCLYILRIFYL